MPGTPQRSDTPFQRLWHGFLSARALVALALLLLQGAGLALHQNPEPELLALCALYLVVAVFHAGLFGLLARLGQLRWPVAMGVSAAWPLAVFPAMGGGMLATVVLSASFAAGAWVVCRIAAPRPPTAA